MFIWTGWTGSTPLLSKEAYMLLDRLHDFSVTIPRCYKYVYVNSFFPRAAFLWTMILVTLILELADNLLL